MNRIGWLPLLVCAAHAMAATSPPPRVVATIFPLYDWTREVAGPDVTVRQLLPAGVEIHSWAPAPADVATLQTADLFVCSGADWEPWAVRLVESAERRPVVFEAARHLPAEVALEGDPHFWTDPVAAMSIVEALAAVLARLDPARAEGYRARAQAYAVQIAQLHREMEDLVRRAGRRSIVFAGHRAFEPMARRYGLTVLTPIEAVSPDVPPSPRAIAELVRTVRETGARFVFHEEIIEPRIARVIAEESGAQLRLLHGLHNRTPDEVRRGETWLSLYRRNLDALRSELDRP